MTENHEVLLLISPDPPQRYQGIARLASERGWHIRLESRHQPPTGWKGDGVIVMLEDIPALTDFIRRIRRRHIPIVDILEYRPEVRLTRVTGDNREIGRLAGEHFRERGFCNAAFFSVFHNHTHDLRYEGFCESWRGNPPERWLWPDFAGQRIDDWKRMGRWLANNLKNAPKPLAVFAWNDYDATHVLSACRAEKLNIPEEISILGVDNNRVLCEHQYVTLSSVAHDHERIGYAAAATLERLMNGTPIPTEHLRIRPHGIVTRTSTETIAVNDPELRPAIDCIATNLSHPLGAAEVAKAIGMSRLRLDRLFAARLGHSVGTEIARRRLAAAKKLLSTTDLNLAEIASRCGYCHSSFFIRSFKRQVGKTPAAWRRCDPLLQHLT